MKKLILLCIPALLLFLTGCKNSASQTETVTLTGSTTILPIVQKCADAYMKKKNAEITVTGGGSENGLTALIDGKTDIANSSRSINKNELEQAKARGIDPYEIRIARDALAIVINKSITGIDTITIDTLRKIYKGEIKNWNELGGPKTEIIVISRDISSGTFETFKLKVMGKETVIPQAKTFASNSQVVQAVSTTPGSIGYVGIGYIADTLKVLKIEAVAPTIQSARDGSYKISRDLYLYTNGAPVGADKNFLDFVLSKEGQQIVSEVGFVPLN